MVSEKISFVFSVLVVPTAAVKQKYCGYGMVTEEVLIQKGIETNFAKTLARYANHGLAQSTWSSYRTVVNHIVRCEEYTGKNLCLPFDTEKTLTLVAWMIEVRELKASSIEKYLSV